MRDGIIDQLPSTLAQDRLVLVLGSSNTVAQNGIKSLINELDREGAWIRFVLGENISEKSMPSAKVGVILTITGLGHGSLTNARRIAKCQGIHCPNQALTTGETKEVLRTLAQVRNGVHHPTTNGSANGNGNHGPSASKNGTYQPVATEPIHESAVQTSTDSDSNLTATDYALVEPPEVLTAFAAIETFRKVSDEAELAVMVLGDRLKTIAAERDTFQRQLAEKGEEVVRLQNELAATGNLAGENRTLAEKNRKLESEVRRLETTIGQFESIIKGVRQK
jgi:hypothetical protein